MLQSMGSQRVGHDWMTEQQQHVKAACVYIFSKNHIHGVVPRGN